MQLQQDKRRARSKMSDTEDVTTSTTVDPAETAEGAETGTADGNEGSGAAETPAEENGEHETPNEQ